MKLKPTIMICALLTLAGCNSQAESDAPVDNAKPMMAEHVQPTAEVYWQAVQYISDENGSREIMPQNDAEWDRTVQAAIRLGELGEELKQPQYADGRGSDWMAFSQGLVDVSKMAADAARTHDPAKVLEAGGTLYNVCSACHEVYMSSPAGLSPGWSDIDKPAD